eukprot:gene8546-biopygen22635
MLRPSAPSLRPGRAPGGRVAVITENVPTTPPALPPQGKTESGARAGRGPRDRIEGTGTGRARAVPFLPARPCGPGGMQQRAEGGGGHRPHPRCAAAVHTCMGQPVWALLDCSKRTQYTHSSRGMSRDSAWPRLNVIYSHSGTSCEYSQASLEGRKGDTGRRETERGNVRERAFCATENPIGPTGPGLSRRDPIQPRWGGSAGCRRQCTMDGQSALTSISACGAVPFILSPFR